MIAFLDPSALPSNPGWPLRNLLAYLAHCHPEIVADGVRILCWRDSEVPPDGRWKSRFGVVKGSATVPGTVCGYSLLCCCVDEVLFMPDVDAKPSAVGWEKNVQGKLGPRLADLAPMMDPTRYVYRNLTVPDLSLTVFRLAWRTKRST